MDVAKKNGELALACEFLGALGLSVVESIDSTRTKLILKFYETFKDRKDELRKAFERPMGEVNELLTVRISEDELGFDRRHPNDTKDYINWFRRNPLLLEKYYSKENPKPENFIPLVKRSVYVKDPNGGKGYHEVTYNDIWLYYIFPEKNFALLDMDLREKIAQKSTYAALIYEEACNYKFRFDSERKCFDMDENKLRMKFGLDRYTQKNELEDEDDKYEFVSKGYTRSRDIYNKILKEKVENVLKDFYISKELPFFIEIEKVEPRKTKRSYERSNIIGRPKSSRIPKYRFWVRFIEIQEAEAIEIKESPSASCFDINNELHLFRITLAEMLRVNGIDDDAATEFAQKIADEVRERSSKEPDLSYKTRKKLEELPAHYEGKKVYDVFKLIRKVLWDFRGLGEEPIESDSLPNDSKAADNSWPSDIEGQISILRNKPQKVYKLMEDFNIPKEYFERVLEDFKLRLCRPDKTGKKSMKTEDEAWEYLRNWLRRSSGNYDNKESINNTCKYETANSNNEDRRNSECHNAAIGAINRKLARAELRRKMEGSDQDGFFGDV